MELRDYARGLRRHWLALVMLILVGVGISFLWVKLQTPVYQADANGIVKSEPLVTSDGQSLIQIGDPAASAKVASFLEIAGWRDVAQYAIDDLGLATTPEELITRVDVTNPANTTILKVVAQAESPAAARALAESWISGMVRTIDEIDGDGTPGSAPVNIVPGDSASLPTEPIFPDLRTSLIVGGVIGLGFGVGFVLMRTASDRRVRATDDVEKKADTSVVGTIPLVKKSDVEMRLFDAGSSGTGPGFAVAEAMRTLRTNLQFMDVDNPPRTIVVTSPLPGDGKSTIACNLALTIAASGAAVTLVDGDLRRSKVAETMGLAAGAGLSDVLAGRAGVADVLQRAPQSRNLFVLAAGTTPPNPSEVLGSVRMKNLLNDLAQHSMVIIDAPPLIPVTDGAVLANQADGALLVVSLGKTTYDLVEKALDTLQKARGRALGIVLNKAPLRGIDASPYSYEYRREYGKPSGPASDTPQPAFGAHPESGAGAPRPAGGTVPAASANPKDAAPRKKRGDAEAGKTAQSPRGKAAPDAQGSEGESAELAQAYSGVEYEEAYHADDPLRLLEAFDDTASAADAPSASARRQRARRG